MNDDATEAVAVVLPALLVRELRLMAARECWHEAEGDSCIEDFAGGNVDDAYEGGVRAGEAALAREIVALLPAEVK